MRADAGKVCYKHKTIDNLAYLCYNRGEMIKLQSRIRDFCCLVLIGLIGIFLAFSCFLRPGAAFADDETSDDTMHFVTIYDDGAELTVKTAAPTVKDVLERAEISINDADLVEPALDSVITSDDYNINIHRARPALVIDGMNRRYVMTASFDPKTIVREAGLTVYDGDEIIIDVNRSFLEAGAVSTYRVERNGGRTLTIEESIPYATETRYDYNLAKGERQLEQPGEDGRRLSIYEVKFENNVEVSRELISEETVLEPVPEIIVVGAKATIPPERAQCANWAREAGVAEEDLQVALDLIYHESGCRYNAKNSSSGAYGIPQALPGNKMATKGDDWETNPVTQIRWMIDYVNGRYGGWQQAMNFWRCLGTCSSKNGTVNNKASYWY